VEDTKIPNVEDQVVTEAVVGQGGLEAPIVGDPSVKLAVEDLEGVSQKYFLVELVA